MTIMMMMICFCLISLTSLIFNVIIYRMVKRLRDMALFTGEHSSLFEEIDEIEY